MTEQAMAEVIVEQLATLPGFLRAVSATGRSDQFGVRPEGHVFALTEHLWHLRDFETEGFSARIRAILDEDTPSIAEFDGDAIARERRYLSRDWQPALEAFVNARAENLAVLRALPPSAWDRRALFHSFGPITLADLAAMTLEHDREHIGEILALGEGCPIWAPRAAA